MIRDEDNKITVVGLTAAVTQYKVQTARAGLGHFDLWICEWLSDAVLK